MNLQSSQNARRQVAARRRGDARHECRRRQFVIRRQDKNSVQRAHILRGRLDAKRARQRVRHRLTVFERREFALGAEEPERSRHDPENAGGGTWRITKRRIAAPGLRQQDDRLRQHIAEVGGIDFAELRRQRRRHRNVGPRLFSGRPGPAPEIFRHQFKRAIVSHQIGRKMLAVARPVRRDFRDRRFKNRLAPIHRARRGRPVAGTRDAARLEPMDVLAIVVAGAMAGLHPPPDQAAADIGIERLRLDLQNTKGVAARHIVVAGNDDAAFCVLRTHLARPSHLRRACPTDLRPKSPERQCNPRFFLSLFRPRCLPHYRRRSPA